MLAGRSLPVLCVHLFHWYGLLQHFNLDVVRVWKLFSKSSTLSPCLSLSLALYYYAPPLAETRLAALSIANQFLVNLTELSLSLPLESAHIVVNYLKISDFPRRCNILYPILSLCTTEFSDKEC